jgi:hypothetical protein
MKYKDIAGLRFSSLVALSRAEKPHTNKTTRQAYWLFSCDCGRTVIRSLSYLKDTPRPNCGCLRGYQAIRHGMTKTKVFAIWLAMLDRCRNPNNKSYKNYGGRGIGYSKEWEDFTVFLRDMGDRPSPKHHLDRIDNNKGYSKENCRWVTHGENQRNKRTNHVVEINGKLMCLVEASEKTGLSVSTLKHRLGKGIPLEKPVGRWAT